MKRTLLSILTAVALLPMAAAADAEEGWTLLGDLHVSDRRERDKVRVGADEGRFDAIRLKVEEKAVQFHDLKIYFENGDVQDVELRSVIRAGQRSRVIDLHGSQRAIKKIVFLYDAQTRRRHRGARVKVYGRH